MWFLFLGCNLPFTILTAVAIGSLICSFIISADAETSAPMKVKSVYRATKLTPEQLPVSHMQDMYEKNQNVLDSILHDPKLDPFLKKSKKSKKTKEFVEDFEKPVVSRHYTCPPTSLEELRKLYGTRRSLWGEWSNAETRQFYQTQLPRALQIDGALGLSLEERAKLASSARHALRTYSRERCHLPGRLLARLYDGLRHLHYFGTFCSTGMTWDDVKIKYGNEAREKLGENATEDQILSYVYKKVVDKACSTNVLFDRMADEGFLKLGLGGLTSLNLKMVVPKKSSKIDVKENKKYVKSTIESNVFINHGNAQDHYQEIMQNRGEIYEACCDILSEFEDVIQKETKRTILTNLSKRRTKNFKQSFAIRFILLRRQFLKAIPVNPIEKISNALQMKIPEIPMYLPDISLMKLQSPPVSRMLSTWFSLSTVN